MRTAPTIHLNGSGGKSLYDDYANAAGKIREAIESMPVPNARDYYVNPNPSAFAMAQAEHSARVAALVGIRDELYEILESISDQRYARENHGSR